MRRGRLEIIIDLLEVAKEEVHKTALVYRTNLNFTLTDKYLYKLEKKGLVEKKDDKYIITDIGRAFLNRAKEFSSEIYDIFDL